MSKTTKIVDQSKSTEIFNHDRLIENLKKIDIDTDVEILSKDEDTYASPSQGYYNKAFDLTYGLDLPSQVKGPWSPIDHERWVVAVENLLARGAQSGQHICRLTGLNIHAAVNFIKEIKERWATNLTIPEVNIRREKLYNENERISDFCWNKINEDPDGKNTISFLKIIGESNTRKARLIGAEIVSLNVEQARIERLTQEEIQQQASKQLGVDVQSLKQLGDLLATEMAKPKKDNE
jgi:DNA-binding protein